MSIVQKKSPYELMRDKLKFEKQKVSIDLAEYNYLRQIAEQKLSENQAHQLLSQTHDALQDIFHMAISDKNAMDIYRKQEVLNSILADEKFIKSVNYHFNIISIKHNETAETPRAKWMDS